MFKFQIGDTVVVEASGEAGKVIGQAHYELCEDSFYIRYKAAEGRAVERWWHESALAAGSGD